MSEVQNVFAELGISDSQLDMENFSFADADRLVETLSNTQEPTDDGVSMSWDQVIEFVKNMDDKATPEMEQLRANTVILASLGFIHEVISEEEPDLSKLEKLGLKLDLEFFDKAAFQAKSREIRGKIMEAIGRMNDSASTWYDASGTNVKKMKQACAQLEETMMKRQLAADGLSPKEELVKFDKSFAEYFNYKTVDAHIFEPIISRLAGWADLDRQAAPFANFIRKVVSLNDSNVSVAHFNEEVEEAQTVLFNEIVKNFNIGDGDDLVWKYVRRGKFDLMISFDNGPVVKTRRTKQEIKSFEMHSMNQQQVQAYFKDLHDRVELLEKHFVRLKQERPAVDEIIKMIDDVKPGMVEDEYPHTSKVVVLITKAVATLNQLNAFHNEQLDTALRHCFQIGVMQFNNLKKAAAK